MNSVGSDLWRALRRGVLIMTIPFFAFIIADLLSTRPDWPVLQRGRYVWLFYWPTIFWPHGDNLKGRDEIATFVINIVTYSLIAYLASRLINRRTRSTRG